MYIPVRTKFTISLLVAMTWATFSIWISQRWVADFSEIVGVIFSHLVIYGIAIIPGFMNAFLSMSLLLDRRPPRKIPKLSEYPDITILVAAYNEQDNILDTLNAINTQLYPGKKHVIVVDDGSTDRTPELLRQCEQNWPELCVVINPENRGKAHALNTGLPLIRTGITITVDADSVFYRDAIMRLVERYLSDPEHTAAVAGAVLVRNSRKNLVTRIQEWDYFLGIAGVKRMQSHYHGTMVAQGAFSLYKTHILREMGGWNHVVGEDIVLTWAMQTQGYRVGFAEDACLFTNVPETWTQFFRQRQRWSRGLIEAFKEHWRFLFTARMTSMFAWWNALFPYTDLMYTVAFLPGIVMALFGYYYIAGPMTLILLPMMLILNWIMLREQRAMFQRQNLRIRRNFMGFVGYTLFYAMILQPACVVGYVKEIIMGTNKSWGTK